MNIEDTNTRPVSPDGEGKRRRGKGRRMRYENMTPERRRRLRRRMMRNKGNAHARVNSPFAEHFKQMMSG